MRLPAKLLIALQCSIAIQAFCNFSVRADTNELKLGFDAYQQKNYAEAIKHLDKYLATNKPDARTIYYLALANLQNGQSNRAKQLFQYIVKAFPSTVEARQAQTTLTKLGVPSETSAATTDSTSSDEAKAAETAAKMFDGKYKDKRIVLTDEAYRKEYATIPTQVSIPVTHTAHGDIVTGTIDGQGFYLQFSHSWETRLSLADLAKAKIPEPKRPPDDKEGTVPLWKMVVDLNLGGVKRKVPATVLKEHSGYPELGSSFFEDLKVDSSGGNSLILRKKDAIAGSPKASVDQYKQEFAKLPDTAEVHFVRADSGHMLVDAFVNGRLIKCYFDTGANEHFGANHLREAGLPVPTGKPDGYTGGWAGAPVPIWKTSATLKIGNMTRTVPITVEENMALPPLVGQEFIRDYQYSIDAAGGRMILTKKTAKVAASSVSLNSLYDIPCEIEGDREFVTLTVNGRKCSHVLIDTGASSTILSPGSAMALGIDTSGGRSMMMTGVGGNVTMREVSMDLRLGPIVKSDFPVKVGGMGMNAIGQDFMSGWRFTVDREAKLLRFFH